MSDTRHLALCKNCGNQIEETGGKLYAWTHVDPEQHACGRPQPHVEREAKHTPGPWEAWQYDSGDLRISPENERDVQIATMGRWQHEHRPENQANARLIAAAPELLEACAESFVDISALLMATINELAPEVRAQLQKTAAKCEAAIRKTKGE